MDDPDMNSETQNTSSKKTFLIAHIAYLVLWSGILLYVHKIFGITYVIGLSLLTLVPLYVSLRMLWKWNIQKKQNFIALGVVVISIFIVTPFLINDWDSKGMDDDHTSDIAFIEFTQIVRSNPAFRAIGCHEGGMKGGHWISGEVFSKENFKVLKALTEKYTIYGIEDVVVITHLVGKEE